MKKLIFGIFAHPDDEAFGPAATLLHETKNGAELHLICLTAGESGMNPDGHADLGVVRLDEWRRAGELMGAHEMHHLKYRDGELCNNDYHEIVQEITEIIETTLSKQDSDYEIELMSMDFNGVTGHIDHIVAARVAAYLFYQQRGVGRPVTRLLQSCIPRSESPESNIDWLYMSAGYDEDTCLKFAYPELHSEVLNIMHAHHSQRSDAETHIKSRGDELTTNYFLVLE
jgi:LmbE family N-acetylglucosaminyl deacetylase